MARSPHSNEAFFREVDDEVRRERMAVAARRYGVAAAIIVVLALVALAGWLLWRNHAEAKAGERAEQLTAAIAQVSAGNREAARKTLEPLAKDGGAYAPLAQMTLADGRIQAGQDQPAATAFMAIAGDASVPQPLRDLALVRATTLDFDRLSPAEVVRRMKPLAVPGNAWFGSAGELTALAQVKMGQKKQAGALLAQVARSDAVPQSLRDRARQLAGDYGVDPDAGPAKR